MNPRSAYVGRCRRHGLRIAGASADPRYRAIAEPFVMQMLSDGLIVKVEDETDDVQRCDSCYVPPTPTTDEDFARLPVLDLDALLSKLDAESA